MGDRWILNLKCPYCNQLNEEIWYAPTCGAVSHKCKKCGKEFYIEAKEDFIPVKKEDWNLDKEKEAFEMFSNMLSQEGIDKIFEERRRKNDSQI